jgi:hypothetical protein
MASVEFIGRTLKFSDGSCICSDPNIQALGQVIIDGFPGYFPSRENMAVEELMAVGGQNPKLDAEQQSKPGMIH